MRGNFLAPRNGISSRFWGPLSNSEIKDIIAASVAGGINWIDTAEAYGNGHSEQMIANSLQLLENETSHFQAPFIATKWWPLGRNATSLNKSIETRLNCLERRPITLYQIHHPTSFSSIERQMEAMALLVRSNKIKYVGVSNFSASQLRKAHTALKKFNIELVSNQVRYNLFDRSIEHNGILTTAKELGISIIAYSPLHQGLLTGKFHDDPRLLKPALFSKKVPISSLSENIKRNPAFNRQLTENWQKIR